MSCIELSISSDYGEMPIKQFDRLSSILTVAYNMDIILVKRQEIESLQSMEYSELIHHIPPRCGLMIFRLNEKALYHIRTNNLTMLFESLFTEDGSDKEDLGKVVDNSDMLEFRLAEDKFAALTAEKLFLAKETPQFHHFIRLSDDYVYLAIQVAKSPFITIQQDTTGRDFYLGPFLDRFMLVELIELFSKYMNTPSCKPLFVDSAPKIGVSAQVSYQTDTDCGKKGTGECKEYCRRNDREELTELFANVFIRESHSLLDRLERDYQALYNDLQFIKAEEIQREKGILENYSKTVRFLSVIKLLNFRFTEKEAEYRIENGMLTGIKTDSAVESFVSDEGSIFSDYRENELLALPKEHFQEMWTVYEKVQSLKPELIDELYRKNIDKNIDSYKRSMYEN